MKKWIYLQSDKIPTAFGEMRHLGKFFDTQENCEQILISRKLQFLLVGKGRKSLLYQITGINKGK